MEDYKVDKWSTICMKNIHYSVPDTLVGKTVSVKIYSEKVVIFHGQVKVAAHERVYGAWQTGKYSWSITLAPCCASRGRYKDRWHSCRCPLRYRNSSRYISRIMEGTLFC